MNNRNLWEKLEKEDKNVQIDTIKGYIYIDSFIKYHRKRIKILKDLLNEYRDKKLVISLFILGVESLAYFRYPNFTSKKRFVTLLSKVMNKKEAIRFYYSYRCQYVHEGFPNPFLDYEDDDNEPLMEMSEKDTNISIFGFTEYPPETLISLYEDLTIYIEDFFNKKGTTERVFKFGIYRIPAEEKKLLKERQKRLKKLKNDEIKLY